MKTEKLFDGVRLNIVPVSVTETAKFRYWRIKKEAKKFTEVFNKYINDHTIRLSYDDYVPGLRTHLLFMHYPSAKIARYVNEVVCPGIVNIINECKKGKKNPQC